MLKINKLRNKYNPAVKFTDTIRQVWPCVVVFRQQLPGLVALGSTVPTERSEPILNPCARRQRNMPSAICKVRVDVLYTDQVTHSVKRS